MKHIKPSSDDIGQRLDRYLRKIFPGAKLGEIYEALRTKKVTIGGKKLPENTRLRDGDVLDIHIEAETLKIWQMIDTSLKPASRNLDGGGKGVKNKGVGTLDIDRVLYEDADILVYDKPAGLIVHSPDHATNEVALIDQIEDYLKVQGWKPAGTFARPALAHRIDRDTSGIIISCLTRKSYEHMAEQFRTRKVQKIYHALVVGMPHPSEGTINAPLLRLDTGRTDEAKMVVDQNGLSAETSYRILKSSPLIMGAEAGVDEKGFGSEDRRTSGGKGSWSLIELSPKTGRTHQIRIHMSHIGHPLIGDKRYGGPSLTRFPDLMKGEISSRHGHLLHAHAIGFIHPNGKPMNIVSPGGF